jgi:CxxC motif-containing protein
LAHLHLLQHHIAAVITTDQCPQSITVTQVDIGTRASIITTTLMVEAQSQVTVTRQYAQAITMVTAIQLMAHVLEAQTVMILQEAEIVDNNP